MNIDKAIKHAEKVAEEHTQYNRYGGFESCDEYAKEYRQIANWLKELKAYKAVHEGSTWRLIDAEALKEELGDTRDGKPVFRHTEFIRMDVLEEAIDKAPTIKTFTLADIEEQYRKGLEKGLEDARPHGEWIYHKYDRDFECSICNTRYDAFDLPVKTWDYCPNCGASMAKKEGESE